MINQNNSIYLIPEQYIPILVKKDLFKFPENAIKQIDYINIPLYILESVKENNTKKSPNVFFLYRSDIYFSWNFNSHRKNVETIVNRR